MQTLRKAIKQLHEGNDLSLNSLVTFRRVQETNASEATDEVFHLAFSSDDLQTVYQVLRNDYKWIARHDFEAMILDGLMRDDARGKGLLYNIDLSYADRQIKTYLFDKLRGHILNTVNKIELYDDKFTSEVKITEHDEGVKVGTLYDDVIFREWQQLKTDNTYSKFLENIGGLKEILSKQQYNVYHMMKEQNATQEQIAKDLNVSQQTVSKTIKAADKRIKKEYMTFKTYQTITKQDGKVYDEITAFRDTLDKIIEFDMNDSFDYFGLVTDWISSYYEDDAIDYTKLHKNNKDDTVSVYDVLVDSITESQRELFYDVFSAYVYKSKDDIKFTKREKDRFVINVIGNLDKYQKKVEQSIKLMNDKFVDSEITNVEAMAKIFK